MTANGIALFNLLLPAMSMAVDQYCNRTWNFSGTVTEKFDALANTLTPFANDTFYTKAHISDTPVNPLYPLAGGITEVSVNGSIWDLNYVYTYGYFARIWARANTIILPNPLGYKSVTIKYVSDDAQNLPALVKYALVQWVGRQIQNSADSGKELLSANVGTVATRFKQDSMDAVPDFVRLALDPYRLAPIDKF